MITDRNLFEQITKRFPDFKFPQEALGLPVVIFDFFFFYMEKTINSNQPDQILKVREFVDDLSSSTDDIIEAGLENLFLNINDANSQVLRKFISELSILSQSKFAATIEAWNRHY